MRAVEIIFDSGADGSALPLQYARAGVATPPDERLRFVDARGCPLNISSARVATVDFGDISLKEEFIVASITSPLLSLGKLMKHGWSLQSLHDGLHLVKAEKAIPVSFKRNSLCMSGDIKMLEDSRSLRLRAVQLRDPLQRFKTTWTKLGAECYAIKTCKAVCVDVILVPSPSLLWYRTTLVKRSGRWQVYQHNLFVSEEFFTGSLETALPDPSSVQEVLTIGHARECTHDQLGFVVVDEPLDLLRPAHGGPFSSFSSRPAVAIVKPEPVHQDEEMSPVQAMRQPHLRLQWHLMKVKALMLWLALKRSSWMVHT